MLFLIIFSILLNSISFARFTKENPNLAPYIGDNKIGLRVNPILTGLKGEKINEEMDLNITLFYQNKYLLKDQEILGYIDSRLIAECPLSSYDPLKQIKEDKNYILSNYAKRFPQYQKALQDYTKFHEVFQSTIDSINQKLTDQNINDQYQEEDIEEYIIDDQEYGQPIDIDISIYPTEENNTNIQVRLSHQRLKLITDQLQVVKNYTGLSEFPMLDSSITSLSKAEIQFLIKYEKLRKQYNEAIKRFNHVISNNMNKYKTSFDPRDPTERFTIMLMGNKYKHIWIKEFNLNEYKNYQSYDNAVWYLQYQLPLTKKDIQAIYQIFKDNEKVSYYVKGKKGMIEFSLNKGFIRAIRELFFLYVKGGLIIDPNTEFPIMRNE